MSDTDPADEHKGMKNTIPLVFQTVDRLSDFSAFVAAAGATLLILNVFVDVIGRKLFNTPFPGTLEYTANWWMPVLALLAFAYTEKRQEHIKVTVLLVALPLRMRQLVEGVFGLLATALLLAMMFYSFKGAMESAGYHEVTASDPPVAIWPFKFVAVLGMGMLALQSAVTSLRYLMGLLPDEVDYDSEADLG